MNVKRLNGFFLTHAKDLVAIIVLLGMVSAGMSHFATASDVERKFTALKVEIKIVSLDSRKARIEDELFRLRAEGGNNPSTRAQIARYEAELRDISQRLRDLEKERR